jgi:hypothetical protein
MHCYNDTHGKFPPAVVYGKDGRPLYSWRVLLLPFIDQEKLYKEFKLDEPWDSPHNLELLRRMPMSFAAPGRKAALIPADHTFCHVFVGRGTAFEHPEGQRVASFINGLSSTLLIVEGGKPVPWTKPEELLYAPDSPLPDLPGPFKDILRIAFADGSVQYLKRDISESALRVLITRNGKD